MVGRRLDGRDLGALVLQVRRAHAVVAVGDDERAVVALYSERISTIPWRALRVATRGDGSSYDQVVAAGRVTSRTDLATPNAFTYAGGPPTRIAIDAPVGLHWTLLVAAANAPAAALH